MNRLIKFRVWHKPSNKWILYPNLFRLKLDGILTDEINNNLPQDFYEIQQFTGFLDKNGREIYEGDFVNCDIKDSNSMEVSFEKILVSYGDSLDEISNIEIIGNIFENPELKQDMIGL